MKKPRTWRTSSGFSCHQFQVLSIFFVLLLDERLLAVRLLSHEGPDVAAEVVHELEQCVPEGWGAEAGDDGEIPADLGDGATDCAAANLTIEILLCGHEEFGIVRAGG